MIIENVKFKLVLNCIQILVLVIYLNACSSAPQNVSQNNNLQNNIMDTNASKQDYSNKPVDLNKPEEKEKFDKIITELNQNRDLWKKQNITDYDYVCQHFAEGMGGDWTLKFRVRGNNPIPFENMKYPELHKYENLDTIEEVFDRVQNSLKDGWSVNIKYNKKFGFPEKVGAIGTGTASWHFELKDFEIIAKK